MQTQAAGAWMEYVRELAQLTGEGEKPAGSAAERRLAQVVTLAVRTPEILINRVSAKPCSAV